MSETPKDKAKDPRRVPPPISFPRELTGEELLKRKRADELWAMKNERNKSDQYVAGSRNPIIETMEQDDLTLLKRDSNYRIPND
jgi:hypothetical protein